MGLVVIAVALDVGTRVNGRNEQHRCEQESRPRKARSASRAQRDIPIVMALVARENEHFY